MTDVHVDFSQRLRKLNRKHAALAEGSKTVLRKDGLVVIKPRRQLTLYPLRFLLVMTCALIVFKAALLIHLGQPGYETRVDKLAQGTGTERAGAWVMQVDPATVYLADQVLAMVR